MATRAPDPQHARRATTAARWAIVVGVVGFGLKLAGWLLTGSDAVFSDALESIVNIVASIGAFLALRYAERPPDEEHPYGHGPMEFVSALFEGILVAVAGMVVLTHCAESLYRGRTPIQELDLGLVLVRHGPACHGTLAHAPRVHALRLARMRGAPLACAAPRWHARCLGAHRGRQCRVSLSRDDQAAAERPGT